MNGIDDILLVQGGPDDLTDNALRQVLLRAPDRGALPDWQLRQTILQRAHDAVAEQAELLLAAREPAPWWHLDSWWKKGERRAVTPWNAAFAMVLVAGLVAVLWQREPVPDARPDADRPTPVPAPADLGRAPLPAPAAEPPAASAAPSPQPAPPDVAAPASDPAAIAPAEPPSPGAAKAPDAGAADGPAMPDEATADARAGRIAPIEAAPAPRTSADAAPAVPMVGAAPQALKPLEPAASIASPPVAAAVPAPGGATAMQHSAEAAPVAPARPGQRTDDTPPPTFAALSQWTELRINHNRQSRTVGRIWDRELILLLNSAAITAAGAQPLKGRAQWRLTLQQDGKTLAVMELTQSQVQWTEGKAPPATGTPPPGALDALRAVLREPLQPLPPIAAEQSLPLADRLERELARPPAAPSVPRGTPSPAPAR